MAADVLILGQGLAGTVLGWELEHVGIPFVIVDDGQAPVATLAAAGLINPITGRRLVKSWRVDPLRPLARESYGRIEAALGIPLWHDLRVRRLFADERERAVFAEKHPRGDLAPYSQDGDEEGFWIVRAARVDLAALISASRARWLQSGRLRAAAEPRCQRLTIDCRGVGLAAAADFPFVPWEFSKGEILEIAVAGLPPDVVLNRRQWIVPIAEGAAWVGATHEAGVRDAHVTEKARLTLTEAAVQMLAGRAFQVTGQRAGIRVNLPDKHPIAGRHRTLPELGLMGGLGAKGALWAPFLARQWSNHLLHGSFFDAEIAVGRFGQ